MPEMVWPLNQVWESPLIFEKHICSHLIGVLPQLTAAPYCSVDSISSSFTEYHPFSWLTISGAVLIWSLQPGMCPLHHQSCFVPLLIHLIYWALTFPFVDCHFKFGCLEGCICERKIPSNLTQYRNPNLGIPSRMQMGKSPCCLHTTEPITFLSPPPHPAISYPIKRHN